MSARPLPRPMRIAAVVFVACLVAPVTARAGGGCPAGMRAITGGRFKLAGGESADVGTFCLDRLEVTASAYAACVEVGACSADELDCGNAATYGKKKLAAHPVNCVDWSQADTYCRAYGKRLPTEAEWEWAARGGPRAGTYPWGEAEPANRVCWDGNGNSVGKGERKGTCAVGANPRGRSPHGIEDLGGNVREWTSTTEERFRVIRGGSWGDSLPSFLAAGFRGWNAPDERMELLGFRCAAPLGAVAKRPVRQRVVAREDPDEAGVMTVAPMSLGRRRR